MSRFNSWVAGARVKFLAQGSTAAAGNGTRAVIIDGKVGITINDISFKGEKFRGLLGSSGMQGKALQFFPSPPLYIHGFPTLQNSYERFNKSFAFLK